MRAPDKYPQGIIVTARRLKTGCGDGWTAKGLDPLLRSTTLHRGVGLDNSGQTSDETVDEICRRLTEAVL